MYVGYSVGEIPVFSDQLDAAPRLRTFYGSTYRIGAYTLGYTRDIELFRYIETAIGVNVTAYSLPDAIKPYYGAHPVGGNIFVRFRIKSPE